MQDVRAGMPDLLIVVDHEPYQNKMTPVPKGEDTSVQLPHQTYCWKGQQSCRYDVTP